MNPRPRALGLHLLGGLGTAGWILLSLQSGNLRGLLLPYAAMAWGWMIFIGAWVLQRRQPAPGALGTILIWAVIFRICGFLATPVMEDDHYRFLWDGRQFALTGNPYATTPASHFADPDLPERFSEILDQVNYPSVHTVYGPICEAIFLAGYWMSPGALWPLKLILLLAELAMILAGLRLACSRNSGVRPAITTGPQCVRAALILGWCPLLIFETSFNAHPEILGVALLTTALLFHVQGRLYRCALFCALAVGAKIVALLLVPFLLRFSWRAWMLFAAALAAIYAPFWWQGSAADLAGLLTFAREWEFNSSIHALVRRLTTPETARGVCLFAYVVFWGVQFRRWMLCERPEPSVGRLPPGTLVFGSFLLLSATVNPWYLLWLAPFSALRPQIVPLAAMALVSLSYVTGLNLGSATLDNFEHPPWVRPLEYGVLALLVAASILLPRLRPNTVRRPPATLHHGSQTAR